MGEISHQSMLNVGVVGNMTQDFGSLKGSFRIGIAVVQIPSKDKIIIIIIRTAQKLKHKFK